MNNKLLLSIAGFLILTVGVTTTLYLSQQPQTLEQSAHSIGPTVSAICQGSTVIVSYKAVISNVPQGVTANITVTDTQNYLNDSFKYKNGDPAHIKTVDTNKSSITPGTVTFKMVASDGFKSTVQKAYPATGPCASPTPNPSVTPKPSSGTTPTICPSLGPVKNLKITCPDCSVQP